MTTAPDMFTPELHPDTAQDTLQTLAQEISPTTPAPTERIAPMSHHDHIHSPEPGTTYHAVIKVIGVGGGGGNAIAQVGQGQSW